MIGVVSFLRVLIFLCLCTNVCVCVCWPCSKVCAPLILACDGYQSCIPNQSCIPLLLLHSKDQASLSTRILCLYSSSFSFGQVVFAAVSQLLLTRIWISFGGPCSSVEVDHESQQLQLIQRNVSPVFCFHNAVCALSFFDSTHFNDLCGTWPCVGSQRFHKFWRSSCAGPLVECASKRLFFFSIKCDVCVPCAFLLM